MNKYQAGDFMESVYDDHTMSSNNEDDVYTLSQLLLGKKFINEFASAVLLKNALICWTENQPLPQSVELYEEFEKNFKKNFFWKQLELKD